MVKDVIERLLVEKKENCENKKTFWTKENICEYKEFKDSQIKIKITSTNAKNMEITLKSLEKIIALLKDKEKIEYREGNLNL